MKISAALAIPIVIAAATLLILSQSPRLEKEQGGMNNGIKGAVATIAVIVAIVMTGTTFQYVLDTDNAVARYVRVDASAASVQEDGSVDYTLASYDDGGAREEVTFGSDKTLRDGAYLELSVMPLRGVVYWEEVEPAALPDKVREALGV